MKNKMRMIKAAMGVRYVSCFVGPPATFLASLATLNLFGNLRNISAALYMMQRNETKREVLLITLLAL